MLTHRPRRHGFTLIELLVVIGIIALLVGILLPVMAKVRASGKATACMVNMRSMATAATAYSVDNDRRLPQPSTDGDIPAALRNPAVWFNALDYYVGNSQKGGGSNDRNDNAYKQDPVWLDLPTNGLDPEDVRTIKMNQFLGWIGATTTPNNPAPGGVGYKFYRLTDIPQPGSTVMFVDGRAHDTPSTSGNIDSSGASFFFARPIYVGLRHEDGANITKIDGSVEHQVNPIRTTSYRGWFDDDAAPEDRPDVTFNFRPDDFM